MIEITAEEWKKLCEISRVKLHQSETFVCRDLGIAFNVKATPYKTNRYLTQEVIDWIKEEEKYYCEKIYQKIDVSCNSARRTYYCLVYKILESGGYRYQKDNRSRAISLKYFCDSFKIRRATLHDRFQNDNFAYCHYNDTKSENDDINHKNKELELIKREIKEKLEGL